jgi:asparagine synthetase B (glutamine-hydrolysing)
VIGLDVNMHMLNNTQQQLHTSPGSEKVQWPSKLAIKDKDKYQVQLASSYKTHEIVFHKTKQDFKNPTFSALWMAYKGCHQQANTMISTLRVNQVIEQQAPR